MTIQWKNLRSKWDNVNKRQIYFAADIDEPIWFEQKDMCATEVSERMKEMEMKCAHRAATAIHDNYIKRMWEMLTEEKLMAATEVMARKRYQLKSDRTVVGQFPYDTRKGMEYMGELLPGESLYEAVARIMKQPKWRIAMREDWTVSQQIDGQLKNIEREIRDNEESLKEEKARVKRREDILKGLRHNLADHKLAAKKLARK